MFLNPRLLQHFIRHMTAWDCIVYGNVSVRYRAVPYIMVAFAMPYEIAAVFA
jgi:hypothetical protein